MSQYKGLFSKQDVYFALVGRTCWKFQVMHRELSIVYTPACQGKDVNEYSCFR